MIGISKKLCATQYPEEAILLFYSYPYKEKVWVLWLIILVEALLLLRVLDCP